ncbi:MULTISPECIES: putative manganese transporter [unclassified Pseudoalteromonas]|uniref:putative manganese transporter n=1 Tax=unclassified Pseudoalteromonas TaxID=194690 RepID=UPI0020973F28|nr:putative manganese transporter [Pseudoalteromonas sp. XMcav2-N]MCO7187831.1 putative manganese transporter [Pseudoalteromonas sp. XMcav2-N]
MLSQSYSVTTRSRSALSSLLANKRLLLPFLLCLAAAFEPLRALTIATLADAFFQVSVFVAGTLAIYYFLIDRLPQLELSYLKAKSPVLEIAMAAVLGALPGCGGAIIVVTQFTKGQASFASVVAVLTATMGDAAFLLLAKQPLEGLIIIALGIAVGIASGLTVNLLHKPEFCQPNLQSKNAIQCKAPSAAIRFSEPVWRWALIPSLIIALLIAFNTNLGVFTQPVELAGAALAIFALTIWALSSKGQSYREVTAEDDEQDPPSKLAKVIHDTHFVTAWVVASFMLYELSVALFGLDLAAWFSEYAVFAPLIAVAIGLLPGCGPQIVVTTLYIQGILPFSALAANAVANDGDALFPALALAPGAAVLATVYSAIPALLVGYGLYYFAV